MVIFDFEGRDCVLGLMPDIARVPCVVLDGDANEGDPSGFGILPPKKYLTIKVDLLGRGHNGEALGVHRDERTTIPEFVCIYTAM